MVRPITMPKLGQSEEVGTLVRWRKKVGDAVAKGDILFEIETDKAVLEVESFFEGTLLKIVVQEGTTVPINTTSALLAILEKQFPKRRPQRPSQSEPKLPAFQKKPHGHLRRRLADMLRGGRLWPALAQPPSVAPARRPSPEVFRISPRAAKLARESAINPSPIAGTGPYGRIVERDVKNYLESKGYYQLRITPAAKRLAAKENIDILTLDGNERPRTHHRGGGSKSHR